MATNILKQNQNLPSAYQEVEYIESSGTQYINTGVKVSDLGATGAIEWNIASPSDFTGYILMGSYYSGAALQAGYRNTDEMSCNYGFSAALTYPANKYQFNKIYVSNGIQKLNDEIIGTYQTSGDMSTNTQNLLLFGRTDTGNTTLYPSLLKGAKIWDNGTLIREFVPCYRKSDNVIGLYDKVNGVFYVNAGSGDFTKGRDILYAPQKMKINILKEIQTIPTEYQEVEYIQSTGTQYIDSGVKLSSLDTVRCKFELTSAPTSYAEGVYGTMESISSVNTFFVLLMRNPTLARVGSSSNQVTSTNVATNTTYDTILRNGTYVENGTKYTFTPHSGFAFNANCYIFKRNQASMTPINGKIYSFEIEGKFNGIPCYRKADGEIGFYDTITGTFFTNAGTGTFLKGVDKIIPSEYQEIKYIQLATTDPQTTGIALDISYADVSRMRIKYEMLNEVSSAGHPMLVCGHDSNSFESKTPYACADNNYNGIATVNYTTRTDINNPREFEINATGATSPLIKIGGWNDIYWTAVGRYYYAKLLNNSYETQHWLIPVYRKADMVIGLYDTVSDVFYVNGGTGAFSRGQNVGGVQIQRNKISMVTPTVGNLLNIYRKEWNDVSYQPTDAVTFDYNKLYYMASSGYIRPNPLTLNEIITQTSVQYMQTNSSWWGIGFPIEVSPNTKYTISAKRNDGNITKINYTLYNSDGSFDSYAQLSTDTTALNVSKTITTGANVKTLIVVVCGTTTGSIVYAENIQVEEGQTQTAFKPYGFEIIQR